MSYLRKALEAAIMVALVAMTLPAAAHDCWPSQCCSGFDCRSIPMEDVQITPHGFFIKERGELLAYADPRVKTTPKDCGPIYGLCTRGGEVGGEILCAFVPNFQN